MATGHGGIQVWRTVNKRIIGAQALLPPFEFVRYRDPVGELVKLV